MPKAAGWSHSPTVASIQIVWPSYFPLNKCSFSHSGMSKVLVSLCLQFVSIRVFISAHHCQHLSYFRWKNQFFHTCRHDLPHSLFPQWRFLRWYFSPSCRLCNRVILCCPSHAQPLLPYFRRPSWPSQSQAHVHEGLRIRTHPASPAPQRLFGNSHIDNTSTEFHQKTQLRSIIVPRKNFRPHPKQTWSTLVLTTFLPATSMCLSSVMHRCVLPNQRVQLS